MKPFITKGGILEEELKMVAIHGGVKHAYAWIYCV